MFVQNVVILRMYSFQKLWEKWAYRQDSVPILSRDQSVIVGGQLPSVNMCNCASEWDEGGRAARRNELLH